MSWIVHWTRDAEDSLTEFWLISSDRQRISDSTNMAEFRLMHHPEESGDFLCEDLWSLDQPPLRLHYVMDPTQKIVTVVAVSMKPPQ